ncbi:GNAT family N-acetyltransferase [Actinospica sp. MGRD01-02]|uniref:GNAT family N-acetyltransferase n=1 Tax=Actinospica acidithermotolerans TaxID=2828514 RepID=A0A941EB95_9ACTN|nr:GNAT family N-acetyltransferase [Actinospica acidithermotolerans]MBR7829625.1 GNAT family N-acetyltransferase [Actinospica acidithermotolerans]
MADVEVIAESGTAILDTGTWGAFAAAEGTVFHTGRFLRSWWHHRSAGNPEARLVTAKVVGDGRVLGQCAFELAGHVLSFAGGQDVVDYMGPIALAGREAEVADALTRWAFDELEWSRAHFSGLAGDAAMTRAITDAVKRLAPGAIIEPYDSAPRIDEAPQGYLSLLNAKRRADVLRKRNRLAEVVGGLELVDSTPATVCGSLERLLAWKAGASPATSEFVAEYGGFMRRLASDLAAVDAGRVVELHAGGRPVAAVVVLRHRSTAYIYNMAYDMALTADGHAGLAPGVVLVSMLIERSLEAGLRFDFLKGAQDYKLRLGGVPVDLIGISVAR